MKQQLAIVSKNSDSSSNPARKPLLNLTINRQILRNTLLRISGAVQVLEEELAKEGAKEADKTGQGE